MIGAVAASAARTSATDSESAKVPQQLGDEDRVQMRDPIGGEPAGVVLAENLRIDQPVIAHQLPQHSPRAGETIMHDERDAVLIFVFEQPLDGAGDRPPDEQVARLFLEQAKLRIDARPRRHAGRKKTAQNE